MDGYTWNKLRDGTLEITGCGSNAACLSIPRQIGGRPVTAVADRAAFGFCVRHVTVPQGVTRIGDEAFSSCGHLASVIIPASVACVGEHAFEYYSAHYECWMPLDTAVIAPRGSWVWERFGAYDAEDFRLSAGGLLYALQPDGTAQIWEWLGAGELEIPPLADGVRVSGIRAGAFRGREDLTRITVPDGVTEIPDEAFMECFLLKEAALPESLIRIGREAFSRCERLEKAVLPRDLQEIGKRAFSRCGRLSGLDIPPSALTIGQGAFANCASAVQAALPVGSVRIARETFSGCASLRRISIPEGVEAIGSHTFSGCGNLEEIVLPQSLKKIGYYTFSGCSGLTRMNLPAAVGEIGKGAFDGCEKLTLTVSPGSLAERYCEENGLRFRY